MPIKPTAKQIENAFQPAKEVDTPERFAGRRDAVKECYFSLMADGAHLAIVGNRGIGKTSLARQLLRIAHGDNSLLERLGLAFKERHNFYTMYYSCSKSTKTTDDLLQGLLTDRACFRDWLYFQEQTKSVSRSYKPSASAGIFSLGAERRMETSSSLIIENHELDAIFANVSLEFTRTHPEIHGLLIVIDEFDRICNADGFGSFLKSISSRVPNLKFCIVGVAQDLEDLIRDHESATRLFAGSTIKLTPMTIRELSEIVRTAESCINNYIRAC
jgi:Cdc6-like AAA superfamily ATPase